MKRAPVIIIGVLVAGPVVACADQTTEMTTECTAIVAYVEGRATVEEFRSLPGNEATYDINGVTTPRALPTVLDAAQCHKDGGAEWCDNYMQAWSGLMLSDPDARAVDPDMATWCGTTTPSFLLE